MKCTWKECNNNATHPRLDGNGKLWANLCEDHHNELEADIGAEPKRMLSAWIKAQGGSEAAARRMCRL